MNRRRMLMLTLPLLAAPQALLAQGLECGEQGLQLLGDLAEGFVVGVGGGVEGQGGGDVFGRGEAIILFGGKHDRGVRDEKSGVAIG